MKPITACLTCANPAEARKIAKRLLNKKLIACARLTPVDSTYWWKGKIENNKETLLMMETLEAKFDDIEITVRQLHSYETPVLMAYPPVRKSKGVEAWLKEAIG